jgi:hypothetical protein
VSPVKYELGFYIPEDGVLHSNRRENPISYTMAAAGKTILFCPCIESNPESHIVQSGA